METGQKNKLQLLMIFGSICLSIMYVNNTTIDGTSFRGVVHRFIPLANYNPVTVGLVFVIVCFVLAFLISDKSIPSKHQHHSVGGGGSSSSKPEPVVQEIIIRTIVEKPVNSSGPAIEQPKTRHEHSSKSKPIIYDFYDKKNRKRFHW